MRYVLEISRRDRAGTIAEVVVASRRTVPPELWCGRLGSQTLVAVALGEIKPGRNGQPGERSVGSEVDPLETIARGCNWAGGDSAGGTNPLAVVEQEENEAEVVRDVERAEAGRVIGSILAGSVAKHGVGRRGRRRGAGSQHKNKEAKKCGPHGWRVVT